MNIAASSYRVGGVEVHPASRLVFAQGREIRIGGRAFDLLLALVERRGQVVSSESLYDTIWPGLVVEPNNLQVQVWALRRVLGRQALITVPRRGYQLVAPIEPILPAESDAQDATRNRYLTASLLQDRPVVSSLLVLLQRHRLITLCGASAGARLALAHTLSERLAPSLAGGAWRLQCPPAGATSRSLNRLALLAQRISPLAGLVVLEECELSYSTDRAALAAVIDGAPDLLFLATSPQALGLPGEGVHTLCPQDQPPPTEPLYTSHSAGGWLRWKPRAG